MPAAGRLPPDPHGAYWRSRLRRLALTVWLGRWLEPLGPALLGGAVVTACLILLARLEIIAAFWQGPAALAPLAFAVAGAGAAALRRGRPRAADLRVRLEEALHLHNRLSAAAEGIIPLPPPPGAAGGPPRDARVVTWRWSQVVLLPAASLALVLVAAWLPVQPASSVAAGPLQKPPPLERLEEIVAELDPARAVDEQALADLRDQVEELASRDPESWYSHAGLEAAETLLGQTESSLSELAGNMSAAATALEPSGSEPLAAAGDGEAPPPGLDAALNGLEHGRLPAHGELSRQLREARSRRLDAAAASRLAEALRRNSARLRQLAQAGAGTGTLHAAMLGPGSTPGNPGGDGASGPAGAGGVARGPGAAPLMLAQNPTGAEPGAEGGLDAFDPDRAALGDAAGVSLGEHELDRAAAEARAAGGDVSTAGTGGDTAWTQRLTPEERRAVRRTFE